MGCKYVIKHVGYVDPNLPMLEYLEETAKLPTAVYDANLEKILFQSASASEAIQWAIENLEEKEG